MWPALYLYTVESLVTITETPKWLEVHTLGAGSNDFTITPILDMPMNAKSYIGCFTIMHGWRRTSNPILISCHSAVAAQFWQQRNSQMSTAVNVTIFSFHTIHVNLLVICIHRAAHQHESTKSNKQQINIDTVFSWLITVYWLLIIAEYIFPSFLATPTISC